MLNEREKRTFQKFSISTRRLDFVILNYYTFKFWCNLLLAAIFKFIW